MRYLLRISIMYKCFESTIHIIYGLLNYIDLFMKLIYKIINKYYYALDSQISSDSINTNQDAFRKKQIIFIVIPWGALRQYTMTTSESVIPPRSAIKLLNL